MGESDDAYTFDECYAEGMRCYHDPELAFAMASEMMHYYAHGVLPVDAVVVERVEVIDGNLLWIHQDVYNRQ
jgi:hypothetical protein